MKYLLTSLALSTTLALSAQTNPDLPSYGKRITTSPVDTTEKHRLLAGNLWTMYFVDFTRDDTLDYGAYELEVYHDAQLGNFPSFAVSWPGGWNHSYENGVLKLLPPNTLEESMKSSVTIAELQKRNDRRSDADYGFERCGTKHTELSRLVSENPWPLPNLTIMAPANVRIELYRERFTTSAEHDQGPENMVVAIIE
jgi:predicted DNA-binding antitoxin AbrB/MazE fold protein